MNICFTEQPGYQRRRGPCKFLVVLLIAGFFFVPIASPRARAIDPVTIAILTPIAIKGAEIAAPYVWRGLQNGGRHMLKVGENIIDMFRFPVGFLQATIGAPFGLFSAGMKNIVSGTLAPFSLTLNVLLIPLAFSGMNLNST